MPTCSRCAASITDADRFCPNCGAPSAAGDASAAPTVAASSGQRLASRPPSDPSSLGHGRFEPGARLGSRYRMVGLLGRGGMGEVYRADDLELGQSVALKFLPERLQHDAEALARFRSEVRLARQIAHPNIARVYDIGEADGQVFLTMEYVDGEDLASVLRRMGRPSRDKAIEIARQLCLGLAAAHERGVLHRDLKPSNVMIDGRGRVRIMDFGLAALAEETAEGPQQVVGTPAYMAPEQFASGQVSVQSDLYSLGLVICELFTGKRVHDTTDLGELRRLHASGSVPSPSTLIEDMDPVIERVVLRCLETDPRVRPPSAYAVLGALPGGDPLAAALAAGETPSPDLVANAGESGGIAPRIGMALLALVLVLFGVATWLSTPHFRPLKQSPEALSFKAASTLEVLGYAPLPAHSAAGFGVREPWVTRLAKRRVSADSLANAGPGSVFFWRRFANEALQPSDIHGCVVRLADPPQSGPGSVSVLFDMQGRLIGLQAIARIDSALVTSRDSIPATAVWTPLLAQAGIDSTRLVPDASPWSAPVATDALGSWTMAEPHALGGAVRVRAGAYHGRPVYFAVVDSLGAAVDAVERTGGAPSQWSFADWIGFIIGTLIYVPAAWLAARNLRLGRGDRRGAFRLAALVFVANAFETVFTWSIPENGLQGLIESLLDDRGLGHSLLHAGQMWISYVAIEPYVRRLWPRMLVSWARLSSGRPSDPLVGRDVLLGLLMGAAGVVAVQVAALGTAAMHLPTAIDVLGGRYLAALATYGGLGYMVAYNLSVTVLTVLSILVTCLLVHLFTKNDRATFFVAGFIATATYWAGVVGPTNPLPVVESVVVNVVFFVALFRFGLLTALAATFASYVLSFAPPAFDPAQWWSGRGMVSLALLGGLALFGFWTALAGQPLLGDPLQEKRPLRA